MKQFLLPILGATCLLLSRVSPVSATLSNLDRAYLTEFQEVKEFIHKDSIAPSQGIKRSRLEMAETYCNYLRGGGTEDRWIHGVLIVMIDRIRREQKPKDVVWLEEEFKREQTLMMMLAPKFYCPEFAEEFRR